MWGDEAPGRRRRVGGGGDQLTWTRAGMQARLHAPAAAAGSRRAGRQPEECCLHAEQLGSTRLGTHAGRGMLHLQAARPARTHARTHASCCGHLAASQRQQEDPVLQRRRVYHGAVAVGERAGDAGAARMKDWVEAWTTCGASDRRTSTEESATLARAPSTVVSLHNI